MLNDVRLDVPKSNIPIIGHLKLSYGVPLIMIEVFITAKTLQGKRVQNQLDLLLTLHYSRVS